MLVNIRQTVRNIGLAGCAICCLVFLISICLLSYVHILLHVVWTAVSVMIAASPHRRTDNRTAETAAVLMVPCFIYTMFLILTADGPMDRRWMVLRFLIPFANLPIWWEAGSRIRERINVGLRGRAQQAAEEINRLLEVRISGKVKMLSRLQEYVSRNQETEGAVRLLQYAGAEQGGMRLAELYEEESGKRAAAFMQSLTGLAREAGETGADYTGWNARQLLKKVTNDIARYEKDKIDLLTVTAADRAELLSQLEQLREG